VGPGQQVHGGRGGDESVTWREGPLSVDVAGGRDEDVTMRSRSFIIVWVQSLRTSLMHCSQGPIF
jgi:hypothetical protein